jgi:hypothetical protein
VAGSACVDLTRPWDEARPSDSAVETDAPLGAAGSSTGGDLGAGGVVPGGQGGIGGSVGETPIEDATTDLPLGATGGSTGGLDGGVDLAQGGAGGGGGLPQGGEVGAPEDLVGGAEAASAGGQGGTNVPDAAKADVADGRRDAALADRAPDAPSDPARDQATDPVRDVPPDRAVDRPPESAPDVAADGGPDAGADGFPDAPATSPGDVSDVGTDQVSTAGLLAYYPCESPGGTSGTLLLDVSGNENHGTLAVGPAPTGGASGAGGSGGSDGTGGSSGASAFAFAAGKVGNGLALNGAAYGYVDLPPGLLAGQQELTVAAWTKVSSTTAFQRIFDFGTDTTNFMYLATANTGNSAPRFRIASPGFVDGGVSQVLEGTQPIVAGTWTHIALVLGPSGASIYVNGSLQASSTDVTLRPADLGSTTANFIGRSEFPRDPYFDGEIDEYRIYTRALSDQEIAWLAGA